MSTELLILAESYSSSSDSPLWILLAPFVLGGAVFFGIYSFFYTRYRNTDKRYRFEQETDVRVANAQAFDSPAGTRRGVRSSTIDGRNNGSPRSRVARIASRE